MARYARSSIGKHLYYTTPEFGELFIYWMLFFAAQGCTVLLKEKVKMAKAFAQVREVSPWNLIRRTVAVQLLV